MEEAVCVLCGLDTYDVVTESKEKTGNYRKVCCSGCGFVYANPRMTEEETEEFYKKQYTTINGSKGNSLDEKLAWELYHSRRQFDFIRSQISDLRDKKVLDIGCAFGSLLAMFKETGSRVSGTEPGKDYKVYHEDLYGIPVHCDLFENIYDCYRDYDLVVVSYALEHVRKPVHFLSKVRGVLKKDGLLYISVPNLFKPPHYFLAPMAVSHFQAFSARSLFTLLQKCGFSPLILDEDRICGSILVIAQKREEEFQTHCFVDSYYDVMTNLEKYKRISSKCEGEDLVNMLKEMPEFRDYLLLVLGKEYLRNKNFSASENCFIRAIETKKNQRTKEPLNLTFADVPFLLACNLSQQGRYTEALAAFEASERLFPGLHHCEFLHKVSAFISLEKGFKELGLHYGKLFPYIYTLSNELGRTDKASEAMEKAHTLGIQVG